MLQSGRLRRLIVIEALQQGKDGSGGIVRAWTPVTPTDGIYAGHTSDSGTVRPATKAAGGEVPVSSEVFTLRWRDGIKAGMRVVSRGLYYQIRHVKDLADRHETLILTCETGVRDG
ncbi:MULTISPECIES: head-tail adaptor protein [unclassified Delftia]|uniref:head-tail adaptor protein n=1 Tax=unclassified Delftia TaxID=2613839 RepID=UPI001F42A6D7